MANLNQTAQDFAFNRAFAGGCAVINGSWCGDQFQCKRAIENNELLNEIETGKVEFSLWFLHRLIQVRYKQGRE